MRTLKEIGLICAQERTRQRLSGRALGVKAGGVAKRTVFRLEKGKDIRLLTFLLVAEALGLDLDELCQGPPG